MMVDWYKPYISGVTHHIALTKKYMEAAGHEVFVFTFGDEDYEDDEPNVIRSTGIPVVAPAAEAGIHVNVRYNRQAQKLLQTMDVAHFHHPLISGTLALRYCKPKGIPVIFTNHTRYDLYYQAFFPMLPESLGDSILHAYFPSFTKGLDLVIAPSAGMRDVLRKYGVTRDIEIVPNGVDLKPIREVKEPIPRSKYGIKGDDVVLLYVGRLGPEKNLAFLLRSFAGVAEAYEDVHLVVAGDGSERENLQDLAAHMGVGQRVHFTGMLPYQDLPRYLAMADAFVTASVTEVHPLTVIEAMAAGLPVLGIESPGVGDIVKHGETGFLSTNDLAAFTAKLVRLVTQHELRKSMGEKAFKEANQYDIERTSGILLDHYRRLLIEAQQKRVGFRRRVSQFFAKLGS
jgi:glycosyltransferase involved in cell wall biosynthesis